MTHFSESLFKKIDSEKLSLMSAACHGGCSLLWEAPAYFSHAPSLGFRV